MVPPPQRFTYVGPTMGVVTAVDSEPAAITFTVTRHGVRNGEPYVLVYTQKRRPWYADVRRLWGLGLNDHEIARLVDRPVASVFHARWRSMKLPPNARPGEHSEL